MKNVVIDVRNIDAVVFDMDGVITDTASVHERAWKETFDRHVRELSQARGTTFEPFEHEDYLRYVDGKPRYDGVRSFLDSRDLELPEKPSPSGEDHSVETIGDEKNARFLELLESEGASVLGGVETLVSALKERNIATAVISSSRNAREVLASAGVADLFDERVDGEVSAELDIPGKPDPAIFIEAARRVGTTPERAVVVEDALAGVQAGRDGGFALVIGVNQGDEQAARDLLDHGADIVVSGLDEVDLLGEANPGPRNATDLPEFLSRWTAIARGTVRDRRLAVFLDYDGTLTPIVERPEDAILDDDMRERIKRLAGDCFVAIVSGRDVEFVREQVALDNVAYLGSHGFDVVPPSGAAAPQEELKRFEQYLPSLDSAQSALEAELPSIDGIQVERKRFGLAIHYRRAPGDALPQIEKIVEQQVEAHDDLKITRGKKVLELRPDVEWDKGAAVRWAIEVFDLAHESFVPIYIGDDLTDEDAFRELAGDGLTVVVADEERESEALFRVEDTPAVSEVLDRMADTCAESG